MLADNIDYDSECHHSQYFSTDPQLLLSNQSTTAIRSRKRVDHSNSALAQWNVRNAINWYSISIRSYSKNSATDCPLRTCNTYRRLRVHGWPHNQLLHRKISIHSQLQLTQHCFLHSLRKRSLATLILLNRLRFRPTRCVFLFLQIFHRRPSF